METRNQKELKQNIVALSEADDFDKAVSEWGLARVYKGIDTCLCGHSPINNICVIKNKKNGNTAIVGSTCVQNFIGIPTDYLFKTYTLLLKDEKVSFDKRFIQYLFDHEIINEWEYRFLLSTYSRPFLNLSIKQQQKRIQINQKVIQYMEDKNDTIR